MMRFRIGSCRFAVSFWFFALVAVSVYFLGTDFVWGWGVGLVHEVGHLAAVFLWGGSLRDVSVMPFGFHVETSFPRVGSAARDLAVFLSGPAAGLWLAWAAHRLGAQALSQISLLLSIFNLLPVSGLDGGSAARTVLVAAFGDRGDRLFLFLSRAALLLLIAAGFSLLFQSDPQPLLLFVGAYLLTLSLLAG